MCYVGLPGQMTSQSPKPFQNFLAMLSHKHHITCILKKLLNNLYDVCNDGMLGAEKVQACEQWADFHEAQDL